MPRFKAKRKERADYQKKNEWIAEPLKPLNAKQAQYMKLLHRQDQIITLGPAGTGKTFLAASVAADMLMDGRVDKIVICRPTIGADEDLGYLPGGLRDKMAPWIAPVLLDIQKRLGPMRTKEYLNSEKIEVAPLAFMRGRTFDNSFVILDEAQNIKPSQMKMFLTRIGNNSRMVVDGDCTQKDLAGDSGLVHILGLIKKYELPVPIMEFTAEDVVRSGICAFWTKIYEREEDELRGN